MAETSNIQGSGRVGPMTTGAAGQVRIENRDNRGNVQRDFVVSNDSSTAQTVAGTYDNKLYICDLGGAESVFVPPGLSVSLTTDSPFILKASGAAVYYIVGQVIARSLFGGGVARSSQSGGGGGGGGGGAGPGGGGSSPMRN